MPRTVATAQPPAAPLAANLRHLCGLEGSVSKTCRILGINRQQFNKYLAGSVRPSTAVLMRICDHFGVEAAELELAAPQFRALFRSTGSRTPPDLARRVLRHLDRLHAASDGRLADYGGAWFVHYPSFSRPGLILRSLLLLEADGPVGSFRSVERLVDDPGERGSRRFRYEGLAFFLRERIFLLGHETGTSSELVELVLFPSYTRAPCQLHGVITGCSALATREPVAAHVVLERLPAQQTARQALRRCGLFAFGDPRVPAYVQRALQLDRDASQLLRGRADAPPARLT